MLASDGSDPHVTDSPEVFALISQLRHHFAEPPVSTGGVTPSAYVTSLEKDSLWEAHGNLRSRNRNTPACEKNNEYAGHVSFVQRNPRQVG